MTHWTEEDLPRPRPQAAEMQLWPRPDACRVGAGSSFQCACAMNAAQSSSMLGAERKPEYAQAQDRLSQEIHQLADVTAALCERLSTCVRNEPEGTGVAEKEPTSSVPIVRSLDELREVVRNASVRIQSVLRRLEV